MDLSSFPAFYPYQPAAWLRISGADAETFLQGQLTNDLRLVSSDKAVYGLWLNQKGKVLADSFVGRESDGKGFWVGSYSSEASALRERLEAYIIADDVVIADATRDVTGIAFVGAGAAELLAARENSPIDHRFPGRRSRDDSVEWIFPRENLAAVKADLARSRARELSGSEMEKLRIDAGIPAVPQDIGPTDLPNEGDLEAAAISYTKGCYLGQEVMARLKSMGKVRRRLLRVAGAHEKIPALPAALFAGERKVGELRSAAPDDAGGFVGLAMLSLMHLDPETSLGFAPGAPRAVRVIALP